MNPELSKYTDAELKKELQLRAIAKNAGERIKYTPTAEEKKAAMKEGWRFYTRNLVEGPGDNGPYTYEVHGHWHNWLDNYRRNHG